MDDYINHDYYRTENRCNGHRDIACIDDNARHDGEPSQQNHLAVPKHAHCVTIREAASYSALNLLMENMEQEGKTVYNMSIGQSPFPVIDGAAEMLSRHGHVGQYAPVMGLPKLREAICEFHAEHDQLHVEAGDVVVGSGSKLLIDILVSVFEGDIYATSPSWPSYSAQCSRAHRSFFIIPTQSQDKWLLQPGVLDSVLSQRARNTPVLLLLCTPNNPSGATYSAAQIQELSAVFRKHGVVVMSDEIYARFYQEHVCVAKFYPERTIVSSGLSKWAAVGGWRIGYHIYPPELHGLRDAVIGTGTHTYSCCPTPVQYATIEILRSPKVIVSYLFHVKRILTSCVNHTHRELTSAGLEIERPSGGYFLLALFTPLRQVLLKRHIKSSEDLCRVILDETNVGFVAATSFYRPEAELSARLVLVCFDGQKALDASRRYGEEAELPEYFVEHHCQKLYQAVQLLTNWVENQKACYGV